MPNQFVILIGVTYDDEEPIPKTTVVKRNLEENVRHCIDSGAILTNGMDETVVDGWNIRVEEVQEN